jgi:hypothetical protein
VKGNTKSYNHFYVRLSSSEIVNITADIGVRLEVDQKARDQSIPEIMTSNSNRAEYFDKSCVCCQIDREKGVGSVIVAGDKREDAPSPPASQSIKPEMEEDVDILGQQTYVVNRKRTKSIFLNERNFLDY